MNIVLTCSVFYDQNEIIILLRVDGTLKFEDAIKGIYMK